MNTAVAKKQSESITLFVGNLADETREADIRSLFAQYGAVSAVRLVPGAAYRRHDGCCYLTIKSRRANAAISGLDGKAFRGSILRVKEALRSQTAPGTQAVRTRTPVSPAQDEPPSSSLRCHYQVSMVEKASAPDGAKGNDWYRYILSSGSSRITGFRCGSLAEVREYATSCADDLNLRGISGKSARAMVPSKKK